jgi:hypothetical protein
MLRIADPSLQELLMVGKVVFRSSASWSRFLVLLSRITPNSRIPDGGCPPSLWDHLKREIRPLNGSILEMLPIQMRFCATIPQEVNNVT